MGIYMYGVCFGMADPIALFNTYDKALEYSKRKKIVYKSLVNIKTYVVYAYENDCGETRREED